MLAWQRTYKDSLLQTNETIHPADTSLVTFYPIDPRYRVLGTYVPNSNGRPIIITDPHYGSYATVIPCGYVYFNLLGAAPTLTVYRYLDAQDSTPTYDLFIPFLDHTSGHETFRDGRYIDLTTAEIHTTTVLIDFNKAYNTYAAYLHHYIYTTPYFPNILPMDIPAGEKIYGKNHGWKR